MRFLKDRWSKLNSDLVATFLDAHKDSTDPSKMNVIFVDSDIFVGLSRLDDSNHLKAVKIFKIVRDNGARLVTSSYVFAESITVISQKAGHAIASDFIDTVKASEGFIQIERIDEEFEDAAIKIFKFKLKSTVIMDINWNSGVSLKV